MPLRCDLSPSINPTHLRSWAVRAVSLTFTWVFVASSTGAAPADTSQTRRGLAGGADYLELAQDVPDDGASMPPVRGRAWRRQQQYFGPGHEPGGPPSDFGGGPQGQFGGGPQGQFGGQPNFNGPPPGAQGGFDSQTMAGQRRFRQRMGGQFGPGAFPGGPRGRMGGGGQRMGGRQIFGGPLNLQSLNLTDEQKQRIKDMRAQSSQKARGLKQELQTRRQEMRELMFDPNASDAQIRAKRKEMRIMQDQLEDVIIGDFLSMRSVLTPEQRQHLPEIRPGAGGAFNQAPVRQVMDGPGRAPGGMPGGPRDRGPLD